MLVFYYDESINDKKNEMMKIKKLLCLCPFLFCTSTYAAYGMIQDPDGYVNVRAFDSLKSKVTGKLQNGEVVSCSFDPGNASFCYALFDENGHLDSGFVHKSRLNFFNEFQKWTLKISKSNEAIYHQGQNQLHITVQSPKLSQQDFKKSAQSYTHYKNKTFFGTDGELPVPDKFYQLAEIKLSYNGKTIIIPKQDLEQYFFPNKPLAVGGLQDHQISEIYSKGTDVYIFNRLSNGGAAQYTLFLHIRDGKLIKKSAWFESI